MAANPLSSSLAFDSHKRHENPLGDMPSVKRFKPSASEFSFNVSVIHPNRDPFTHQKVIMIQDRFFARPLEFKTDQEGKFSFTYPNRESIPKTGTSFILRVIEETSSMKDFFGRTSFQPRSAQKP